MKLCVIGCGDMSSCIHGPPYVKYQELNLGFYVQNVRRKTGLAPAVFYGENALFFDGVKNGTLGDCALSEAMNTMLVKEACAKGVNIYKS